MFFRDKPKVRNLSSVKNVVAAIAGNALEFYELTVYGFLAPVIAMNFFPNTSKLTGIANVFVIFFIGYLARPLGAIVFGWLGDTFGRKLALLISILLMAISTFAIAFLPTYHMVGILAPLLLLILRMLQGISCGGEYAGSMIFLVEHAPQGKQGFYGSFGEQGVGLGFLLAMFTVWLVHLSFSETAVVRWAWRLPFLLGLVIGLLGWYMRRHVSETKVFADIFTAPRKFDAVYRQYKMHIRTTILIIGVTLFGMAIGHIVYVFAVTYMSSVLHYSYQQALAVQIVSMLLFVLLLPAIGRLGDWIGRRRVLTCGIIACTLWSWPYFWLLQQQSIVLVFVAQLVMAVLSVFCFGTYLVYAVEMVPMHVRFTAVGLGLALSDSIFGGMTPYVSTVLIEKTHTYLSLVGYMVVCALISLFAIYRHWVRETKYSVKEDW